MSVRTDVETTNPVSSRPTCCMASLTVKREIFRDRRDGGLSQRLDDGPSDGESQPAPRQSLTESCPALRLSALDRPDRPAEELGRLLMSVSFEVAKHDRHPVLRRQTIDLLMDRGVTVGIGRCFGVDRARLGQFDETLLVLEPTDDRCSETRCRSAGDLMEPGPQRIAHPERRCLADQHQKSGLEGILGIVLVA